MLVFNFRVRIRVTREITCYWEGFSTKVWMTHNMFIEYDVAAFNCFPSADVPKLVQILGIIEPNQNALIYFVVKFFPSLLRYRSVSPTSSNGNMTNMRFSIIPHFIRCATKSGVSRTVKQVYRCKSTVFDRTPHQQKRIFRLFGLSGLFSL